MRLPRQRDHTHRRRVAPTERQNPVEPDTAGVAPESLRRLELQNDGLELAYQREAGNSSRRFGAATKRCQNATRNRVTPRWRFRGMLRAAVLRRAITIRLGRSPRSRAIGRQFIVFSDTVSLDRERDPKEESQANPPKFHPRIIAWRKHLTTPVARLDVGTRSCDISIDREAPASAKCVRKNGHSGMF